MMPHPETVGVVRALEYQELLRVAAQQRLAATAEELPLTSVTKPRMPLPHPANSSVVLRLLAACLSRARFAPTPLGD